MDGKHDVICIEAKKVFDFCFQEHHVERMFPVTGVSDHTKVEVECHIDTHNITCKEVSPREPVDRRKHKALVCLAIHVPERLRLRCSARLKNWPATRRASVTRSATS